MSGGNTSSGELADGTGPESSQRARREGDGDYRKLLGTRQVRMIALGGAIGTGLFLGAGGRLATAGPALVLVYAVTGFFVFLILRALGELVLHRPSSGAFVSYAREFYGERTAFVAGWMYWMLWALTSVVDVTAAATYIHYWGFFTSVPQWVLALGALAVVLLVNLLSVRVFGELEFWFAMVKVLALSAFLLIGGVFLAMRFPVDGRPPGPALVAEHGGLLPHGLLSVVVVVAGVAFAYASVELVGIAAGETPNPEKVMPRAINGVVARIVVFYVGSVLLLALLLPHTAYTATESPFVTFFSRAGIPYAADIMNFVVLTAALSSLNAGLYSTGRILRSMAMCGEAPRFTARMTRSGVPVGGILLTASVTLVGVGLNFVVPRRAFEIGLHVSALGTLTVWAVIVLCQLRLYRLAREGRVARPAFRMPGSPYTSIATLLFVAGVLVVMAWDYPVGTYTVASIGVIVPALVVGWLCARRHVAGTGADVPERTRV
ncbi:amino acid permease [Marinactinospora rubrisoli]|uniref:Amino acid permease n=1 Tax=Marinactinospora rubrisoli TaxID=2715399 RepID=A0ABW2KLF0_9ACTN